MNFPGRVIKVGEKDDTIVLAIGNQLTKRGIALPPMPGIYDSAFASAVRLFQSLNVDVSGKPLHVDGEVGPMTWGSLFGAASVASSVGSTSSLAAKALAVAVGEIGKMEMPIGSNGGADVDKYLDSTGLGTGYFWCMAFVHWCFMEAANQLGTANPFPKTAGVLDAWNKSSGKRISKSTALGNLSLVKPGAVFILDYGTGLGHTGFVSENVGGALTTVEGNTNPSGGSNGIGVFQLKKRNVSNSMMKGFIIM